MPPFSCNFLARKSLSSLLCKTFEAKIQSAFLLNKSSYAPKNYIEAKIRKLTFFGNFQTQCFYAFLEWIEALWSQKQSFKNSDVEVPILFPKVHSVLASSLVVWSWQDDLSKKSRVVCELSIYLKSAKKCFPLLRDKSSASAGAAFGCQFPSFVLAKAPVQQLCGYGLLYHGWKAKQGGEKKKSSFRGIL